MLIDDNIILLWFVLILLPSRTVDIIIINDADLKVQSDRYELPLWLYAYPLAISIMV